MRPVHCLVYGIGLGHWFQAVETLCTTKGAKFSSASPPQPRLECPRHEMQGNVC